MQGDFSWHSIALSKTQRASRQDVIDVQFLVLRDLWRSLNLMRCACGHHNPAFASSSFNARRLRFCPRTVVIYCVHSSCSASRSYNECIFVR